MRSLYWLTAITLVAAAVATVAIADYGRRHPNSFAGALITSMDKPIPVPEPRSEKKAGLSETYPVTTKAYEAPPALTLPPPQLSVAPQLPLEGTGARKTMGQHLRETMPSYTTPAVAAAPVDTPQLPLPHVTPTTVDINAVPEHKQLREEALRQLQSLQPAPPRLPPATMTAEVRDEFSFDQKPLQPLYVPMGPPTQVIMPPPSVVKDIVQLPRLPGVSASNQISTPRPETFEVVRGPEIMPGLHAARPAEEFNPVQDTLLTLGELMSAMNPTTYLLALPVNKKVAKPVKTEPTQPTSCVSDVAPPTTVATEDKRIVSDTSTCSKGSGCCKNACSEEILVRTYSIAEFTTTAGTNHEDLIRLITTMVSPDCWNTKDANIEYFPLGKCLVVRQRGSVQDQVEDLLSQLRNQVQRQQKTPVISRERTSITPVGLELVPIEPREDCQRLPRVITIESNRCVDEEVLSLMPITPTGRLVPVPMTQPRQEPGTLVPTQFEVKPVEGGWFFDRPLSKVRYRSVPDYFPLHLPYAPLPEAPQNYEEQLLQRVGYVNYTADEVDQILMMAFAWEEER